MVQPGHHSKWRLVCCRQVSQITPHNHATSHPPVHAHPCPTSSTHPPGRTAGASLTIRPTLPPFPCPPSHPTPLHPPGGSAGARWHHPGRALCRRCPGPPGRSSPESPVVVCSGVGGVGNLEGVCGWGASVWIVGKGDKGQGQVADTGARAEQGHGQCSCSVLSMLATTACPAASPLGPLFTPPPTPHPTRPGCAPAPPTPPTWQRAFSRTLSTRSCSGCSSCRLCGSARPTTVGWMSPYQARP